jgi:hypothetical protein
MKLVQQGCIVKQLPIATDSGQRHPRREVEDNVRELS